MCYVVGLDSSVAGYADCFALAGITGRRLLTSTNEDLEHIGVIKLGHQEILLQSIALLQTLVRLFHGWKACCLSLSSSILIKIMYLYFLLFYMMVCN